MDGSWKDEDLTSEIGWVLELLDGTIDLIDIKGMSRSMSPLHTEMHGLFWAMASLKKKQRYCSMFVTDAKEVTLMVTHHRDEWSGFQPELEEFKKIRKTYMEFALIHKSATRVSKRIYLL